MGEVNLLALGAASVASFAFGALWYSPLAFQNVWIRASGAVPEEHKRHPVRVFGLSFVFTVISASVFAVALGPAPALGTSLSTGALIGGALVATSMGINYQFATRSLTHWVIDSGFQVGRFVVMGLVLGSWH